MISPYDWQEGIQNRSQYIEGRLANGLPVLAVSLNAGILLYTRRRQTRKVYDIYDRLAFCAIGQPSDIESVRSAALEFASREGYQHSENDVTIRRVVSTLAGPIRRAFGEYGSAPMVARCLFAELGADPAHDQYFTLDYDGDYVASCHRAALTGKLEDGGKLEKQLEAIGPETSVEDAMVGMAPLFLNALGTTWNASELVEEVVLLERDTHREDRFRILRGAE
jgi:proteasome alpha subunit